MNRKFDVKLRKVGNSYVVTIPKDFVDRFEVEQGDFLVVGLDSKEIKRAFFKKEASGRKLMKDERGENEK